MDEPRHRREETPGSEREPSAPAEESGTEGLRPASKATEDELDVVERASLESFPASDAPGWILGTDPTDGTDR